MLRMCAIEYVYRGTAGCSLALALPQLIFGYLQIIQAGFISCSYYTVEGLDHNSIGFPRLSTVRGATNL
jgi:hypothetical protein